MSRVAAVLVAATLIAPACGGAEGAAPAQPKLPRSLAESLAERSEAVAARLDAGDSCGAAEEAASLEEAALAAIESGRVPTAFEDELAASVAELTDGIPCEEDDGPERGKGKGKGKNGKGRG